MFQSISAKNALMGKHKWAFLNTFQEIFQMGSMTFGGEKAISNLILVSAWCPTNVGLMEKQILGVVRNDDDPLG